MQLDWSLNWEILPGNWICMPCVWAQESTFEDVYWWTVLWNLRNLTTSTRSARFVDWEVTSVLIGDTVNYYPRVRTLLLTWLWRWLVEFPIRSTWPSNSIIVGLLGGKVIGLPPVLNFGSEELKAKVVPEVLSGKKFICLAISEAHAGSDVMGLKTTAVKSPDGKEWIINGERIYSRAKVVDQFDTFNIRLKEMDH